jgi:hypothetical protein
MDNLHSIMAHIESTVSVEVTTVNSDGSVMIRNSSGEHHVSATKVIILRGKSHACCDAREALWHSGAGECGCLPCRVTHQVAELLAAPAPEPQEDDDDYTTTPEAWIASPGNAILQ